MAYKLNGTNQWLSCSSAPAASLPLTMACWFNSEDATINQQLIGLWDTSNAYYWGLFADGTQTGDPVRIFAFSGPASTVSTTSGYTANKWHHACGVIASTTSRTVYIDGGSSATSTVSHTLTPNALRLGRFVSGAGVPSLYLKGSLAEVGIWTVELTAAEIASLARGVSCRLVRPQSLVFYAPLVRDLVDEMRGLTITNNNTATQNDHPRVYA